MPDGQPILDYAPSAAAVFGWRREGAALVLTVPPLPLWRKLPWIMLPLAVGSGAVPLGALACAVVAIGYGQWGLRLVLAPVVGLATLAVGWLSWLEFKRRLRLARRPMAIRMMAEELDVTAPGASPEGRRVWPRGQVLDVAAVAAGAVPALQPYLDLWVTTADVEKAVVRFPWPRNEPMAQVEDNLRDVLGLPAVER